MAGTIISKDSLFGGESLDGSRPKPRPPSCAHVSRLGVRCPREPVEGYPVCILHGASEDVASESVRKRMLALQAQSLEIAEELLVMGDDKVRTTLVMAIWDRTGLGPKSTLQVNDVKEDLSELSELELAERAEKASRRLRELHALRERDFEGGDGPVTH